MGDENSVLMDGNYIKWIVTRVKTGLYNICTSYLQTLDGEWVLYEAFFPTCVNLSHWKMMWFFCEINKHTLKLVPRDVGKRANERTIPVVKMVIH